MANFTEEAIKRSFRELLRAYPLSEISVKKIAAACGINRNTFYYHFRDITTLIEEVMNDDTDTLIANNPKIDSLEACMRMTLDFVAENRVAIMNIYNSVSRLVFEKYLWKISERAVAAYWENNRESTDGISHEKAVVIRDFYVCELFGLAMNWVNGGMDVVRVREKIPQYCELLVGHIQANA